MSAENAFQSVINKYRKYAFSERDKGDKFERLMYAYLRTDPYYSNLFNKVWLWKDFPGRKDFGGKDTGIDLVAHTTTGEFWAVQCKCFQEHALIDKPAVDSFLALSGKKFIDQNAHTIGFSHRLWIATTNHWGSNAEEAIRNQYPPVNRIHLRDLEAAPVDWLKLDQGLTGEASRASKKTLLPHQVKALELTHQYFKSKDRGKLIMACGTGKTLTALKIAEKETNGIGLILVLVPSIALLGQTLREWSAESCEPLNAICICSDPEVSRSKRKNEDIDTYSIVDLALPASTNVDQVLKQFKMISTQENRLTVVFSTYQSIEVIAEAQRELIKQEERAVFDLIICDEAHRTTGVTLVNSDESAFIRVHDENFLKASKRLYMTATPRLYSEDSKLKAIQADAILCSMDDVDLYGEEIYRLGFGKAVDKNLLSDYKVLILTIAEQELPGAIQQMLGDKKEIKTKDALRLIGCINALSKQIIGDDGSIKSSDPKPMKSAVAFCSSIENSKHISKFFNDIKELYYEGLQKQVREKLIPVSSQHIDGTMRAPEREDKLSWLKSGRDDVDECRLLSNVRCLSEGVDVPSLDAILFLSARNSQIDVVQSVGRVMRKAPGKNYGYIIIPIVVPTNIPADEALNENENYKVVWTVLNALRSHDDRFNATINKIELNQNKPEQIIVGRPDQGADSDSEEGQQNSSQFILDFEKLQSAVFARMVLKVGKKRYWEQWAKDVADIAQRHIARIDLLVKKEGKHQNAFQEFLIGLQKNINPAITKDDALEMIAQHIITRPVFEALFEQYSFAQNNAVSVSMQTVLELIQEKTIDEDNEKLEKFYDSVKSRVSDIDNSEGRQKVIVELYDKFFKTAFPKQVEKLGIVYTPVPLVDFIIRSVEFILNKEFARSLGDENIHILDPFTGTGTFITRLLQSGIIKAKDLSRKYNGEIHANEIILLAYYIAAINIENAYHDLKLDDETYEAFPGICLTDTFQLWETNGDQLFSKIFEQNSNRALALKNIPLRVIIGNPPYSKGQKSANDNARNQSYSNLDARISETYAAESTATNKNALYDSYFKAFRWSSDRLSNGGIIGFVTNGKWLTSNVTDGFRKCLEKEFSSIYVFNLRGDCNGHGEPRRREAGNVFGEGTRTPITITFLVKNPDTHSSSAQIYYHDIGDYLSQKVKLNIVKNFGSIENPNMNWQQIKPNVHGDWLQPRNNRFQSYIPLEPAYKFDTTSQSVFILNSMGVGSSRDPWVYNSSKEILIDNMKKTIAFYNEQVDGFAKTKKINPDLKVEEFIDTNPKKISWSSSLIPNVQRGNRTLFDSSKIVVSAYRPFFKQYLYFGEKMIHRRGQFEKIVPSLNQRNLIICVSSAGTNNGLSVLMTDQIADSHFNGDTQCFPLYIYEEFENELQTLFDGSLDTSHREIVRKDGISNFILEYAKRFYGERVSKEDIFYYVYGLLHNPEYRTQFGNDLSKMLPRIPFVDEPREFWIYSKQGRALAELHVNYEKIEPYPGLKIEGTESEHYMVDKIRFLNKDDMSCIAFNSKITIKNIPLQAYDYSLNGKSAIEWIMDKYQISVDNKSGIKNNPNDWQPENPRYIFDLLLSIIHVSLKTVKIVNSLPKLNFE